MDTAPGRRRVPRWALPGELAAFDGSPAGRRTVRDWVVDTLLFLFAVLLWLIWWEEFHSSTDPAYLAAVPSLLHALDPWVGAAACAGLWWRRRFPLALAIAMVPALMLSSTATGAVLVSLFTLAIHRGWLPVVLVGGVQLAQVVGWAFQYQPPGMSLLSYLVNAGLVFVVPLAFGMVVRYRRQLMVWLRREAELERREHRRRLADARRGERERIAREMHDVLAHRISLLSVHAGALSYRTARSQARAASPLTGEELAAAVDVIRDNAHLALTELREVLTVLRGEPAGGTAAAMGDRAAPPPRLADLDRLVAEARAAGQAVTLEVDAALADAPPRAQEQRTVYRVVQEGLTNARKHAPRAPVAVRVGGLPGQRLAVAVTNPLPHGRSVADIPGSGAGLAGLAERVALDGGTLRHGAAEGGFQLAAQLPWQA